MRIVVYCPDRHVSYDGHTVEREGIGGGVTVRVRTARALAALGHHVSLVCNTPREAIIDGVHYQPLERVRSIRAEVLLVHSTGGDLDVTPLLDLDVRALVRVLLADGEPRPRGALALGLDAVCSNSNAVARQIIPDWPVEARRVFVTHHGVDGALRSAGPRSPFELLYFSHPSKGLAPALGVLERLRRHDARYRLHVAGGNRLWGGHDEGDPDAPGVVWHGLLGQTELAALARQCGFAFHLQRRVEPFGLALVESMAAGAIPLASPVGAYCELIRSGRTGFLIDGDPLGDEAQDAAVETILRLSSAPDEMDRLRQRMSRWPLSWDEVARTRLGIWHFLLTGRGGFSDCPRCAEPALVLADGLHCTSCATYTR
jgi:glycosyltransferase involved in cell wall biosynthesis